MREGVVKTGRKRSYTQNRKRETSNPIYSSTQLLSFSAATTPSTSKIGHAWFLYIFSIMKSSVQTYIPQIHNDEMSFFDDRPIHVTPPAHDQQPIRTSPPPKEPEI
jgi:hypothetical protein